MSSRATPWTTTGPRNDGRGAGGRGRGWGAERDRGGDRTPDEALRREGGGGLRQPDRPPRRGVWLPRPERGGEDDHAAHAPRPRPAHRGPGDRAGRNARQPHRGRR